jgi:hypothetical protein
VRFAGDGSTEPCRVMARRVISAMQRYVCTWVNSGSRKSTLETTRLTHSGSGVCVAAVEDDCLITPRVFKVLSLVARSNPGEVDLQ